MSQASAVRRSAPLRRGHHRTIHRRVVGALATLAIGGAGLVVPSGPVGADPARPHRRSGAAPACDAGPRPFADLPGVRLTPTAFTSRDDPPVRYVMWRGFVPSFDGLPLSVDVTVPCGSSGPRPTVVMAHGFTDDKTVWEETGRTDTVDSEERPGPNSHWNNIWFASRGYTVLTYTARGWHDSCGPDVPDHRADHPAPQCAGHQWWIHLDDTRWEVRDAQWLTAGLVQGGAADPDRLAVTGGSYGGGPASMAALLGDRVVCGGAAVPAALGPDPCSGKGDGDLAPWTTPDGTERLRWAASLPLYTFGDLVEVLAPNGRWSDGWSRAPEAGDPTDPFGVPLESTLRGLILAATAFGALAPKGTDPTSDIQVSADRLFAGNPFGQDEAVVVDGIEQYRRFKSPVGIVPTSRTPIFWVQGFTDALFPGNQALAIRDHVLAEDRDYPFKLFFGDIGHDYASERLDEWKLVHEQMNAFLDHHLRPDRTPDRPTYDVGATVTRCLDHDAPMTYVHAADWHALHPDHALLEMDGRGTTSTATTGAHGEATDPISTATLPGPDSYKGCRILDSLDRDPAAVTFEEPVPADVTLMGAPVVRMTVDTTAGDAPIAVRLWDVDPKGSRMGLVTRGIYRMPSRVADGAEIAFQLFPQGYRFPAGHRIRVEVTANDAPTFQASNIEAEVTVRDVSIDLPTTRATEGARGAGEERAGSRDGDDRGGTGRSLWDLAAIAGVSVAGAAAVAFGARTRHRRSNPHRT
jgi:predicted acyl esterase